MDTTKNILLAITIILFALGAWPIAILSAVVVITLSEVINYQRKQQLEKIESEIKTIQQQITELKEKQ